METETSRETQDANVQRGKALEEVPSVADPVLEEIKKYRRIGYTFKEIAKIVQLPYHTVYKLFHNNGRKPKKEKQDGQGFPNKKYDKYLLELLGHERIDTLCKLYGVSKYSMRGYLWRLGIKVKGPSKLRKVEREEEVRKTLESGDTYTAIGKDLGISRQRVHQIAKKYLKMKSKTCNRNWDPKVLEKYGYENIPELKKIYDTTHSTVTGALKRHNIKRKKNFTRCKHCNKKLPISHYARTCRKCRYRINVYRSAYGATIEDYDRLFEAQNGKCAFCETKNNPGKKKRFSFALDKEKKPVALICNSCRSSFRNDESYYYMLEEATQSNK
jgi:hypothetical protein